MLCVPASSDFCCCLHSEEEPKQKIIVFFELQLRQYRFRTAELHRYSLPGYHGKMKQQKRTTTFFEFCNTEAGICVRPMWPLAGWTFPLSTGLSSMTPRTIEKLHPPRRANGARGGRRWPRPAVSSPVRARVFKVFESRARQLEQYEPPKVANVQSQLEQLVEKNYYLNRSARDGYRSYLLAYASHGHKDIFDVHSLDLTGVARGFGFMVPPKVTLNFKFTGKGIRQDGRGRYQGKHGGGGGRQGKERFGSSGHAFSAENPYGKRKKGDTRQFQH